jgi:hypothetical protein
MKHWTQLLPEAGRLIDDKANRIHHCKLRIHVLKQQVEYAEDELTDMETEIEDLVKTQWTEEEIMIARAKFFNP